MEDGFAGVINVVGSAPRTQFAAVLPLEGLGDFRTMDATLRKVRRRNGLPVE